MKDRRFYTRLFLDYCSVKITYSLSPQAKGKIEDPTDGYKTDQSGLVIEKMLGLLKKPN